MLRIGVRNIRNTRTKIIASCQDNVMLAKCENSIATSPVYRRSFVSRKKSRSLKELTVNAGSVANLRRNSYFSIACKLRRKVNKISLRRWSRGEKFARSRVDRDGPNVRVPFFYYRASFPFFFFFLYVHISFLFWTFRTFQNACFPLFFLSICRSPCIRFRAK